MHSQTPDDGHEHQDPHADPANLPLSCCRRVAHRILRNHHDAEDACQKAKTGFHPNHEAGNPRALYHRKVHDRSVDILRTRERRRARERSYHEAKPQTRRDDAVPALQRKERDKAVRAAVAALAPHYRNVVELHYFEGKLLVEVSEILHKPVGTVKSLHFRALRELQRLLADQDL